jgi:hypothetical protein
VFVDRVDSYTPDDDVLDVADALGEEWSAFSMSVTMLRERDADAHVPGTRINTIAMIVAMDRVSETEAVPKRARRQKSNQGCQ